MNTHKLDQVLLADSHIVAIERETWAPLGALREEYFTKPAMAQGLARTLKGLIALPYIITDFDSHAERKMWRGEKASDAFRAGQEELGKCFFDDALRANIMHYTAIYSVMLADRYRGPSLHEVQSHTDRIKGLYGILADDGSRYDLLTVEQKIAHVRSLKKEAYSVLRLVCRGAQ
jgi:hypothetical protein